MYIDRYSKYSFIPIYIFVYTDKGISLKMETKRVVFPILSLFINGIMTISADKINDTATLLSSLRLLHSSPGNYDYRIPPYELDSDKVKLRVRFMLKSILEIDEVQGTMTTAWFFDVSWADRRLVWDPTIRNEISTIYVHRKEIWTPYLVLANDMQKAEKLGNQMGLLRVFHNGDVHWEPSEVLISQCQIDMTYFPYDKQTCNIKIKAGSYLNADVAIDRASVSNDKSYNSNSIWDIESMKASKMNQYGKSFVLVQLNLRRKSIFFFVNIILPILIVGFISNMVFIIPSSSGEKIGFSVTMFLSFAVYLTTVSNQLPKNSDKIALINIYIVVEVFLSVLTLVITSVQVRMSNRRSTERVKGIYMIFINIAKFKIERQRSNKTIEIRNQPEELTRSHSLNRKDLVEPEESRLYSWIDVSDSIDVICFWVFMIFNILTTTVILSVLVYN